MKVLVTGGAGYVGYSVIGCLFQDPAVEEVVVMDNLSRGEFSILTAGRATAAARFVEADILDGRALERAVDGATAVIHLAATVQLPTRDGEAHSFDQINNWGSAQVAAAIEATPSVTDAVYLSSVTVYGPSERAIDVDTVPQPNTFYGVTKLRGEAHFRRLAGPGRRIHVVRAGNVFGVNGATRFDTVVNRFLLDGRFKGMLQVIGNGHQTRSFIDVERLALALTRLLTSSIPSGTLNFVDHSQSVIDIATAVQSLDPGMQRLHVDQDMRMLDARVKPSPELGALVGTSTNFRDLLAAAWSRLAL